MSDQVTLRPATAGDCELCFAWANDPVTRAMSFNSAAISHAEHVAWFAAALEDGRRRLFIAEDAQGPLGLVRLGVYANQPLAAEIGINLAPERRGQGLSHAVLERCSAQARDLGLRRLVARIRRENAASQRAFQRAGYALAGEEAVGDIMALRYEIDLTRA